METIIELVPDNHYVKGAISGMFGIFISHPVDTIKTHIQSNKNFSAISYKPMHLYRGISAPLIGVGLEKSLVFGTYNFCRVKQNFNVPVSGAISGFVASLIVSPYERIKILHQNQTAFRWKECTNPRFIFKGLSATFTREVPGFAIYFSTYEYLKNKFYTSQDKQIDISSSFVFGGIAGSMAWLFIYPQDRIKTIIQSNNQNKLHSLDLVKTIWNQGGLRHFYSGFSMALARAILLHSGTFCMMEILNKN
jgi:solute carrier family 25 carnitine/acylcarnitine transporter 20/29